MKKFLLFLFAGLIILLIVSQMDLPLSKENVIGTYVNTYFSDGPCCVEAPHEVDTLILSAGNIYSSGFYGSSTYKLSGLKIEWQYECGTARYSTYMTNKLFEEPRIILNYDLNHYYRKIK